MDIDDVELGQPRTSVKPNRLTSDFLQYGNNGVGLSKQLSE